MASTHSPRFARPSNLEGQFRRLTMAMAALALTLTTSCTKQDELSPAAIELTTPVIQLDGVAASTRAAQSLESVASGAGIHLYLHDSEARVYRKERSGYYDGNFSNGINWTAFPSVTVTGGEGRYRAGIEASISLKATADMPAIVSARYAYRGSVNVETDGTFTPDGTLEPYSAAVHLNLKDADGTDIDPAANSNVYRINPVGLAQMYSFATGSDSEQFPNGTADPVPDAMTYSSYQLTSSAQGDFTPGTYPATWENRKLVTSADYSQPWPLFEVTYCKDGFEWSNEAVDFVPAGDATTWTVSYPAAQLKLEPGKLYTFTATLGADAHITLDASSVSISDWTDGNAINIGR